MHVVVLHFSAGILYYKSETERCISESWDKHALSGIKILAFNQAKLQSTSLFHSKFDSVAQVESLNKIALCTINCIYIF